MGLPAADCTAELLTSYVSPSLGTTLHTLRLVGLMLRGALGRRDDVRSLTLAIALAALPRLAWYPTLSRLSNPTRLVPRAIAEVTDDGVTLAHSRNAH
jgi:hypothetical protein